MLKCPKEDSHCITFHNRTIGSIWHLTEMINPALKKAKITLLYLILMWQSYFSKWMSVNFGESQPLSQTKITITPCHDSRPIKRDNWSNIGAINQTSKGCLSLSGTVQLDTLFHHSKPYTEPKSNFFRAGFLELWTTYFHQYFCWWPDHLFYEALVILVSIGTFVQERVSNADYSNTQSVTVRCCLSSRVQD